MLHNIGDSSDFWANVIGIEKLAVSRKLCEITNSKTLLTNGSSFCYVEIKKMNLKIVLTIKTNKFNIRLEKMCKYLISTVYSTGAIDGN